MVHVQPRWAPDVKADCVATASRHSPGQEQDLSSWPLQKQDFVS